MSHDFPQRHVPTLPLTEERRRAFDQALAMQAKLAAFRREFAATEAAFVAAFHCKLKESNLAEIYVAREFGLELAPGSNADWDARHPVTRETYSVKQRAVTTTFLDVPNHSGDFGRPFDFTYLVLVNLREDSSLEGLWILHRSETEPLRRANPGHGKWQIEQKRFRRVAGSDSVTKHQAYLATQVGRKN